MKKRILSFAVLCALSSGLAHGATVSDATTVEDLKALIKAQQQELENIKNRLAQYESSRSEQRQTAAPVTADSPVSQEASKNSIGGYGELAYSNYSHGDRDQADLARFVLFFGHEFNDHLRFNSEVEWEHGVTSSEDQGEVEIEQAYLDYSFSDAFNVKSGLFLIPLGLLNEKHEPPAYYGVFRNEVETRIIPTTWREGGLGVHGKFGEGFSYDIGLTTGFDVGKLDDPSEGIRSAHQELTLSNANDLSVYGALNYRAPGLLVGGGIFSGNTGQNGASNPDLADVNARMTLWDVHAQYQPGPFDFQALYARGSLSDASQVNAALLAAAEEEVTVPFAAPKRFDGWYVQGAYRLALGDFTLAPFVRYERFDIEQQQDIANGLLQDPLNKDSIKTVGLNFYIDPQVVVKLDYQKFDKNSDSDRINLGIGYQF